MATGTCASVQHVGAKQRTAAACASDLVSSSGQFVEMRILDRSDLSSRKSEILMRLLHRSMDDDGSEVRNQNSSKSRVH